jgi:4,5-dihydroxyphthalate decarboxylase
VSELVLNTAIGNYGHTKPLKDGTLTSPRFALEHVEISPVPMIFRRMVRNLEFDVAEMALSTYICAREHGKKFTGIPIMLTRSFYHGGIAVNVKSGIESPADLAGRRVGVRSYTYTPGVWTRGILQTAYGLDLESVNWVITGDEHVAEYEAPSYVKYVDNSDLAGQLISGEIDAAIGAGPIDSPEVRPLFSEPGKSDSQWFDEYGIYPISHMMVVKNQQLEANPWLAEELYSLFESAKKPLLDQLDSGASLSGEDANIQNMARIVGGDPLPFGLESSLKTLETFIQFTLDQQIIHDSVTADELFPVAAH